MNAELAGLIKDYVEKALRGILIGCVASIDKHDLTTMRADVKPLIMFTPAGQTAQSDYAIIPDIPVLFIWAGGYYIRPEYKRGDLVWVTFATYDISPSLSGRNADGDGVVFPRESAAVVQGIAKRGWTAPSDISLPGLLLGHKDGAVLMHITDAAVKITGNVEITGDVKTTGDIVADGQVTAMKQTTPINLSTHTHPTGVGPSGAPTPGT